MSTDMTVTTVAFQRLTPAEIKLEAEMLVKSGFFEDSKDVAKAYVKVRAGQELGIEPYAAMTGINIIKGKPSLSANLVAGLIRRHPRYDYEVLEHTSTVCRLRFLDKGQPKGESHFTLDMAKRAGLLERWDAKLNKRVATLWAMYPEGLLFARAITMLARTYCPDVSMGGIYYEGELDGDRVERAVPHTDVTHPTAALPPAPDRAYVSEIKTCIDNRDLECLRRWADDERVKADPAVLERVRVNIAELEAQMQEAAEWQGDGVEIDGELPLPPVPQADPTEMPD